MNTQMKIEFEEDFLYRNNKSITTRDDLALTELIANAWDAGATKVDITIPNKYHDLLTIEDNGTGMTLNELKKRWLTLGYNRLIHQGMNVIFPEEIKDKKRIAYGHNGIGRHSMFCFNNTYQLETWKENTNIKCDVTISKGASAFELNYINESRKNGHGTKLSVFVKQNLPDIETCKNVLSARFLYDPEFEICINGEVIQLDDHKGLIKKEIIKIDNIELEVYMIDSSVSGTKSVYHGIAFWVGNRLVGKPTWELGNRMIRDGRTRLAKTHTVIVKSNDLINQVLPDWTGFYDNKIMDRIYDAIADYVNKIIREIFSSKVEETKEEIVRSKIEDIKLLSPYSQYEIANFVDVLVNTQPEISQNNLDSAVSSFINLEKTKSGKSLLEKLSNYSEDDIESLNRLLDNWDVKDILKTIDEIDNRILIIEAISRLCGSKDTDELHTLHPLVAQARWLFGPEYDSEMFVSNRKLKTIVRDVLQGKGYKELNEENRRPDLIFFDISTIVPFYFEDFNEKIKLQEVKKILIIELKKGGHKIGENEMNQAKAYANALKYSESFTGDYKIISYVVGDSVETKMDPSIESSNIFIYACTYNQLVSTANRRMFSLRKHLSERYDNMETENIVKKVLKESRKEQLDLDGIKKENGRGQENE